MPAPTVQNVLDATRGRLSDNITVATGEIFTNAVLLAAAYPTAYREMWDAMGITAQGRVRRKFYTNLAAYTSQLNPVALGLVDLAEPEEIAERGSLSTLTACTTGTASPIVVTKASHGLSSNQEGILSNIAETLAPCGRWFITVVNPNTFSLNGSVTDGTAGTGGIFTTSSDKFVDLRATDELSEADPADTLGEWVWEDGVIRFRGATEQRQLRITYIASGTPPTTTSVSLAIDNCLNYLSCRIGGLAANDRGWYQMADRLNTQALGPGQDPSRPGGFLRQFLQLKVLEMQRTQRRRQPFRPRRDRLRVW